MWQITSKSKRIKLAFQLCEDSSSGEEDIRRLPKRVSCTFNNKKLQNCYQCIRDNNVDNLKKEIESHISSMNPKVLASLFGFSIENGNNEISFVLAIEFHVVNHISWYSLNKVMSPLLKACSVGNLQIALYLLNETKFIPKMDTTTKESFQIYQEIGNHLSIGDENGNNCLHYACQYGMKQVVIQLIQFGIDIDRKNKTNQTAYEIAQQSYFGPPFPDPGIISIFKLSKKLWHMDNHFLFPLIIRDQIQCFLMIEKFYLSLSKRLPFSILTIIFEFLPNKI